MSIKPSRTWRPSFLHFTVARNTCHITTQPVQQKQWTTYASSGPSKIPLLSVSICGCATLAHPIVHTHCKDVRAHMSHVMFLPFRLVSSHTRFGPYIALRPPSKASISPTRYIPCLPLPIQKHCATVLVSLVHDDGLVCAQTTMVRLTAYSPHLCQRLPHPTHLPTWASQLPCCLAQVNDRLWHSTRPCFLSTF